MLPDDGKSAFLDGLNLSQAGAGAPPGIPFSFGYAGNPADLTAWTRSVKIEPPQGGKEVSTTTFMDFHGAADADAGRPARQSGLDLAKRLAVEISDRPGSNP